MIIHSMTASFGKLKGETLTLQPGLNVISGENEWGKSTWCAFLLAMLYGLETRIKSTKTTLAPKERYAPWTGSAMSGKLEISWQGKDITIERSSKGRTPMGEFRAYETASGLAVPELTAENCGLTLLGVERDVFVRAGFIRQSDLPVAGSEALRARLTALVTTGDDTGDAKRLAEKLKELKNKCKYNKSGLLPQAQAQLAQLEEKLQEYDALESRCAEVSARLQEAESFAKRLENHLRVLENAQAEQDARQVAQARRALEKANREKERLEEFCRELPTRQEAQKRLRELSDYVAAWDAAIKGKNALEIEPEKVECLPAFRGLSAKEAQVKAETDAAAYRDSVGKFALLLCILGVLVVAGGGALALLVHLTVPGLALCGVGAVLLGGALLCSGKGKGKLEELGKGYGTSDWKQWPELADRYAAQQMEYEAAFESWNRRKTALENRLQELTAQKETLCEGRELGEMESLCRQVLDSWDRLDAAALQALQAQEHLNTLLSMARAATQTGADDLNLTWEQTQSNLKKTREDLANLRHDLGVCKGRMESLGQKDSLQRQLEEIEARVAKLQNTYDALTLAQETLTEATQILQRRFAPRISDLAGGYMEELTQGRYSRITLTEDLTVLACAQDETVVREALWRSDGTMDQLYLSLRLALSEVLTPDAPLVLDDALVRFDDRRLRAAVKVLGKQNKQILLFTCQSREKKALEEIRRS